MTEPLPAPLWSDATDLCRDLQQGTVTATAVMVNVYARIAALTPALNALVSLIPKEQAMTLAAAADATADLHACRSPNRRRQCCPSAGPYFIAIYPDGSAADPNAVAICPDCR